MPLHGPPKQPVTRYGLKSLSPAAERHVQIVGVGLVVEAEEAVGDAALDVERAAGADGEDARLAVDRAVIGAVDELGVVPEDLGFLARQHVVFAFDGGKLRHQPGRDRARDVDDAGAEIPVRAQDDVARIVELHAGTLVERVRPDETAEMAVRRRDVEILDELHQRAVAVIGEPVELAAAGIGTDVEHRLALVVDGDADEVGIGRDLRQIELLEGLDDDQARAFDLARIEDVHVVGAVLLDHRSAEIDRAAGVAGDVHVVGLAVVHDRHHAVAALPGGDVDDRSALHRDDAVAVGADLDIAAARAARVARAEAVGMGVDQRAVMQGDAADAEQAERRRHRRPRRRWCRRCRRCRRRRSASRSSP